MVVGAPGLLHHLPGGPAIDISENGGGRSRILGIASQGGAIDISDNGGGHFPTPGITSQGACHRRL
jgi:hypothetical protein